MILPLLINLVMINGIIVFPHEKNVAALPTGWEVGGGPPGAAYQLIMASFKRLMEIYLNQSS